MVPSANRIVGGQEAPAMIPWQVYIWGCGGTILDKCTILSAAHCQFQAGGKIRAGSTNRYSGGQVKYHFHSFQLVYEHLSHKIGEFCYEYSM